MQWDDSFWESCSETWESKDSQLNTSQQLKRLHDGFSSNNFQLNWKHNLSIYLAIYLVNFQETMGIQYSYIEYMWDFI